MEIDDDAQLLKLIKDYKMDKYLHYIPKKITIKFFKMFYIEVYPFLNINKLSESARDGIYKCIAKEIIHNEKHDTMYINCYSSYCFNVSGCFKTLYFKQIKEERRIRQNTMDDFYYELAKIAIYFVITTRKILLKKKFKQIQSDSLCPMSRIVEYKLIPVIMEYI